MKNFSFFAIVALASLLATSNVDAADANRGDTSFTLRRNLLCAALPPALFLMPRPEVAGLVGLVVVGTALCNKADDLPANNQEQLKNASLYACLASAAYYVPAILQKTINERFSEGTNLLTTSVAGAAAVLATGCIAKLAWDCLTGNNSRSASPPPIE